MSKISIFDKDNKIRGKDYFLAFDFTFIDFAEPNMMIIFKSEIQKFKIGFFGAK